MTALTTPYGKPLDTCPGCGKQKLEQSAFCKGCSKRGERHPSWHGGPYNECACGEQKTRAAKTCRECRRIYVDGKHITAAEKFRTYRRTPNGQRYVRAQNLRRYGLTPDDYDRMLAEQGGVCAACGQEETHRNQYGVVSMPVDHDHTTGAVRGLICSRCNRSLGLLGDSPDRIAGLLRYRLRYGGDAT